MKLLDNWRDVLRSAWSVKLNMLAIIFACAEVILPMMTGWFPERVMTIMSIIAVGGSTYFRLFHQPDLHKDDTSKK